ncbi:hypothetical protein BS47DRAFT_1367237 [Hydnum rufescens UP504]|uniref:Uncharacterized protein n=1 Tax=Hydnum rufescens UP504 TaxID=1448309 RepID=A0A9P6AJS6_9AGAM|nr:hypothetical protein BS47DRAFT_1367237 [Hydnum rufescens UP504]
MVWILTLHLLHSPAAKIPSSITAYSFTFTMPPKAQKMYKRNKWVTVLTASPAFSKGKMLDAPLSLGALHPPNPIHGGYHRGDTPLFLDDGEGSEDEIDHSLENGGDIDSGDELEQKAKEWEQPLESVMQIGNLGINTREQQSRGNPWNAFHHSYEKDSDPNQPHHEYVEKVIQPAYHSLILEHGGEDSAEWKKKAKELVEQHNASKAAHAAAIALSPATMGKVIKQTTKCWTDDLKWMATMNIHGFCTLFSSIPDEAASKHNAVFTGTPAMKAWLDESFPKDSTLLKMIHSHILGYQGEQQLQRDVRQKVPKTMHMMWKEIS